MDPGPHGLSGFDRDLGRGPDLGYFGRPTERPQQMTAMQDMRDMQDHHYRGTSNGYSPPPRTSGSTPQDLRGFDSGVPPGVGYGRSFSSHENHIPHMMGPHLDRPAYPAVNQGSEPRFPHLVHANSMHSGQTSHLPHPSYTSQSPQTSHQPYPSERPVGQPSYYSHSPHSSQIPPLSQPFHTPSHLRTSQQYLQDPSLLKYPSDPFNHSASSRMVPTARSSGLPGSYPVHPHQQPVPPHVPHLPHPPQASNSSYRPQIHTDQRSPVFPGPTQADSSGQWTNYTFEHYDPYDTLTPSSQKGKQTANVRFTKPVQNSEQPILPSRRSDQHSPESGPGRAPQPGVTMATELRSTPAPVAPNVARTGSTTAGPMRMEEQEIPQSTTVEALLESGFIPPFVSMGEDMTREEQEAMFQALPLEDRKRVLESFLAERQRARDPVPELSPRFASSAPGTPTVPEKNANNSRPTHEKAGLGQAEGPYFGVVLLNALHEMGDTMGRRLDDMEQTIGGINVKVSKLKSEQVQHAQPPGSQQQSRLSRASARRQAALNATAEDFSDELGEVSSDDDARPGGFRATPSKASHHNPTVPNPNLAAKDPLMAALMKCVRLHCDRDLLQITSAKKDLLKKWPPITDADLEARGPITSRDDFCIDFVRGWKTTPLNTQARDFFWDDFLSTYRGGQFDHYNIPAQYFKRELVLELLDSHIANLRPEYASARRGDKDKDEKVRQRKNANTRQSTTLEQRWNTVTNPIHGIQRHALLLNKLRTPHVEPDEPAGFRIDENGKKHRVFNMLRPAWQSAAFWKFMQDLDDLKTQADSNAIGESKKPGALARERVELTQPKVIESAAPTGLWKNCYDEGWLAKQTMPNLRALKVTEGNYDFSLEYRVEEGV